MDSRPVLVVLLVALGLAAGVAIGVWGAAIMAVLYLSIRA